MDVVDVVVVLVFWFCLEDCVVFVYEFDCCDDGVFGWGCFMDFGIRVGVLGIFD